MKTKLILATAGLIAGLGFALPLQAGTLENMERERSLIIDGILDPDLKPAERQGKVEAAKPRLMDLERMVLRDDSLKGRNTPTVRKAFQNYVLTFMVHAAAEKNISIADNWLDQIGVSTESLMAATVRQRW